MRRVRPARRVELLAIERRRFAKAERRRRRLGGALKARAHEPPETFLSVYANLAGFSPLQSKAARGHLHFPEVLSLIDNPEQTLRTLEDLARMMLNPRCSRVRIDQSDSAQIDHGAASIVNKMAMSASRSHGLSFEGRLPRDTDLAEIVVATGLPRALGVPVHARFDRFLRFDLTSGRKAEPDPYQSTDFERVSEEFGAYIDRCLRKYDCQLTIEGMAHLVCLLTEVIENVERHSGQEKWWIGGYLRQSSDDASGECYVCIFNLGRTIHQSLSSLPPDSLLRSDIESLIDSHRSKGMFGSSAWTEETLWTLYALQEGVSCRNVGATTLGTNGVGTVEMMEFFELLGGSDGSRPSKMCILSGATHIVLDGTYRMAHKTTPDGQLRRVIAFNDENDLHRKPDKSCVRSLSKAFPGTAISIRFSLDRAYLKKLVTQND